MNPRARRNDIDGLRAVAVLAVIVYHFNIGVIHGGFVGVDVFFVISGYLITGIIFEEMKQDRFSFIRFYARRVRRIFPALFAMLIACIVAGLFILLPVELAGLGKSAIATLTFVSNFYFYTFRGYFVSDVELKPLLHTWSLAVEEQFYFFFPVILLLLFRYVRRAIVPAIVVLAVLSYLLAEWLVGFRQEAAFYFSPPRFWEMLAGSFVAIARLPRVENRWRRVAGAAGSLGLILAACILYKPMMPFPGFYALPPVLGTAGIIYAGLSGPTFVSRFLSLKPIVFVGLLSYSLYLWHWPIAAYGHMVLERPLQAADSLVLVPLTFVLSYLSWRLVEEPVRRSRRITDRVLWAANGSLSAAGIAVALLFVVTAGLPVRFSPQVNRLAAYMDYDDRQAYRRGTCFLDGELQQLSDFDRPNCLRTAPDRPNYMLIGDSHGAHWWSGLGRNLAGINLLQATSSGCKPLLSGNGLANCRAFMKAAYQDVAELRPDAVILSARWRIPDIPMLLESVDHLSAMGIKVFVLGPIAEYRMGLARLLTESARSGDAGLPGRRLEPEMREADLAVAAALKGHDATYVSVYDTLCPPPSRECRTIAGDGAPMQWDYGHLTESGSNELAAAIVGRLK